MLKFLSAAFGPKKPEITSPKMKAHHLVLLGMCSMKARMLKFKAPS